MSDDDTRRILRSILGTDDEEEIERALGRFTAEHFGAGLAAETFRELSIGAVFGLRLTDGRAVVLKAHPVRKSAEYLEAAHRVQRRLHENGFPAPRPILGPEPFGLGLATVYALVEGGEIADAHEPAMRREMARTLAELIRIGSGAGDCGLLAQRKWPPSSEGVWPPSHYPTYDFDATTAGAGWIDELGEQGRTIASRVAGEEVVGHGDWRAGNMRFRAGRVHVVFDWDSLVLDHETAVVGGAAGGFPMAWPLPTPPVPSPAEVAGFIADYEAARGMPFAPEERRAIGGVVVYQMGYSARCEHAVDPDDRNAVGSFREALREHGDEYLSL